MVGEGGSRVVIRGIRHGSGLNQEDLGADGINSSALEVACPPPGIGAEITRKFLGTDSELLTALDAVLFWNVVS